MLEFSRQVSNNIFAAFSLGQYPGLILGFDKTAEGLKLFYFGLNTGDFLFSLYVFALCNFA